MPDLAQTSENKAHPDSQIPPTKPQQHSHKALHTKGHMPELMWV